MYLLENTPEAHEMREQVKNLLLSENEANIILALQIIEAGGFYEELKEYISKAVSYHIYNRLLCNFHGQYINNDTYRRAVSQIIGCKLLFDKVSITIFPYKHDLKISLGCVFLDVSWNFYFILT